jgi:hypothetical protein
MIFDAVLEQVTQLLQHQGRVSYRVLKRQFALDDNERTTGSYAAESSQA